MPTHSPLAAPLAAYLERIGWPAGQPLPLTRATVDGIVARHVAAIPFENLDPLRRHQPDIASPAVHDKLVRRRRGGYCFEHNRLLADSLRGLGFTVTELSARVMWRQAADFVAPRYHMLLQVDSADGALLVDAGFGGLSLSASLLLASDAEQRTPHETFRLRHAGDEERILEARLGGDWQPLYRFDLTPHHACDFVAPNYYLATHPDSVFVNNLMVARAGNDGRWTLFNRQFTTHRADGSETRLLDTPEALVQVMLDVFLLPEESREQLLALPLPPA